MVAVEQQAAVAQDTLGEIDWSAIQDYEVDRVTQKPLQVSFQVERESFETWRRGVDVEYAHIDIAVRPRTPPGEAAEEVGCRDPLGIGACREKIAQFGLELVRRVHGRIICHGPPCSPPPAVRTA
jgi:hypothetical protein